MPDEQRSLVIADADLTVEILTRSGVDIRGWGGQLIEDERPFETLDHVKAGRADAIAHDRRPPAEDIRAP